MAKSDVKSQRSGGFGGHRGRSSYSYERTYDDQGRGRSKQQFERVESIVMFHGQQGLDDLPDEEVVGIHRVCTFRYGLHDWERIKGTIKKHLGTKAMEAFVARFEAARARKEKESEIAYELQRQKWQQDREAEDAKEMKETEEQTYAIQKSIELAAGSIRSDLAFALHRYEETDLQNGEWVDDPVACIQTGYGFAEETRRAGGVKIQVTLSLDCSNSMWYNKIGSSAVMAFRTLGMALDEMKSEFPNDLFVEYFTFAHGRQGDTVNLAKDYWSGAISKKTAPEHKLGNWERFRYTEYMPSNAGEDTQIAPLFKRIADWEDANSDPGAIRLDIVITDGVLERKADIKRASEIQERRDGQLTSIFLNFLPESDWSKTWLPRHCVQYAANVENIGGMLRTVMSEFLALYM